MEKESSRLKEEVDGAFCFDGFPTIDICSTFIYKRTLSTGWFSFSFITLRECVT